ncbi:hypothetical protein AERO9A_300007 [Aeromonas salmonicida]|nr:hypothetical protein AERO9A_300007 [Aeromonas salmonicida]
MCTGRSCDTGWRGCEQSVSLETISILSTGLLFPSCEVACKPESLPFCVGIVECLCHSTIPKSCSGIFLTTSRKRFHGRWQQ